MQKTKLNNKNKKSNQQIKPRYLELRTVDSKYNSIILQKFVNALIIKGKKYLAYKLFYLFLLQIKVKLKKNPIYLLFTILDYLKPLFSSNKIIKQGMVNAIYFLPIIKREKQLILAIKNLTQLLKKNRKVNKKRYLYNELLSVVLNLNAPLLTSKHNLYYEFGENQVSSTYRWDLKLRKTHDPRIPQLNRLYLYREQRSLYKKYKTKVKKT